MSTHQAGVSVGDVVATSATLVSVTGLFHEFQWHEIVGTTAGMMAIAYYLFQFGKWIKSYFK